MELNASLVLDVILLAMMALVVFICYHQGLIASLISLVGTVGSYIAAALLSRPLSSWIYKTFVEARVVESINEKLSEFSVGGLSMDNLMGLPDLSAVKDSLVTVLAGVMEQVMPSFSFFSGESTSTAAEAVIDQVQSGMTLAESIAQYAVEPAVVNILSIAVFFVIFAVVMFVAKVLIKVGKSVNHVPLVGGINKAGGLGLGVIYAAVLGLLASMAMALIAGISGDKIPFLTTQVLEDTYIINWLIGLRLW